MPARSDPLPANIAPQLATLVSAPPGATGWTFEIKFDGYRILSRLNHGAVRLFTRNANDWTDKMESLAAVVADLPAKTAWLDGEVVVLNERGVPDFNALQNAFDKVGTEHIVYFVFDLLYLDGKDLRQLPFSERRAILESLFANFEHERVRLSQTFHADGASILKSACEMGLEGVIAKRLTAKYVSSRTDAWVKVKCQRRQEFVIGGFTARTGSGREVGSLLLGVYDDAGNLRSAGSVGTGWDSSTAAAILRRLEKIEIKDSPFAPDHGPTKGRWSKRAKGAERWVEPTLVGEVSFVEITPEGHVRHPIFKGMRQDKPANSVALEKPAPVRRPPSRGVKISHADRVIDPSTGLTKGDLVNYYESVAHRILPHLRERPTSLVRGPTGITGELFYQKHSATMRIPGLRDLDPALWPDHDSLIEVPTVDALVGAAQMNVIEFHTWNSTASHIDTPDRVIFDLDPGEGVTWPMVQEGAMLTKVMLTELGLESWLKTSGGKGLHVVVPLAPKLDYAAVSAFSESVVVHMAKTIPSRFVAKSGGRNRIGKIFVDYLRNGHGATTAAAFSARSRPGLGVSIPVSWDQLAELTGGAQWTIVTAGEYLATETADPWKGYRKKRQTLTTALKRLR